MGIGKFRHRIKIYSTAVQYEDDIGGDVTWNDMVDDFDDRVRLDGGIVEAEDCIEEMKSQPYMEVWANVDVDRQDREGRDRTIENNTKYIIMIRSTAYDIDVNDLIEWKGVTMTIHGITEDYVNRFKTIEAWG